MMHPQSTTRRHRVWALAALGLALAVGAQASSTISWSINIIGGTVAWSTSSPATNGVFTKSGKITFNEGAYVDLTFTPYPGGTISKIMKNTDDVTGWLDGANHIRFGPVGGAHIIIATFSGGSPPTTEPIGSFGFVFPTNNTALTAIADVTGNYQGNTPTARQRAYDVSVSQDESGKLAVIGTVAGISPEGGGPLQGGVGAISTVDGKPTAKLKGTFKGTRDGETTTASGSATGPVEINDVGGGTNAVAGTGSYSAKVAGVPYSAKNVSGTVPTTPNMSQNLRKVWSLDLDIKSKFDPKNGKPYIGATALLQLPNGDLIAFPERKVRYSSKTGYALSFSRGINTSIIPNAPDNKSRINIKGMLLLKAGDTWTPTAGTLDYQFLGQKGKANLLDFLVP